MSIVAEIRRRSGLSQARLAERAGTSRTRLSAYEHGHTAPELDTLERLVVAGGVELALAPRGAGRLAAQVEAVGAAVTADRRADAVRLIAELIAWIRDGVVDLDALRPEPASVGDQRWDAFLGGVAELLFSERGRGVPGWASSPARILDRPWFLSDLRSLWPEILVTTPGPLAARGVLVSRHSLESV